MIEITDAGTAIVPTSFLVWNEPRVDFARATGKLFDTARLSLVTIRPFQSQ
jgi:hypothetical protein